MLNPRRIAVALLGIGIAVQDSLALSQHRNPLNHITRIENPVLQAPAGHVHSYSKFDVSFELPDRQQKVRLTLEPNHDILSDSASINVLDSDGTIRSVEVVERTDHKVFKGDAFIQREGSAKWAKVGWARITIRRDGLNPVFEGAFRVEQDHHHIMTSTNYRQTRHRHDPKIEDGDFMVVWRDSDIMQEAYVEGANGELKRDLTAASSSNCLSDELDFNMEDQHPVYEGITTPSDAELGIVDSTPWWALDAARTIFRRQDNTLGGNGNVDSLVSTIGSTAGCPTTRRVALVGIATDCTYFDAFDRSKAAVTENIINLVNTASVLYEDTFNISLGIQNLTIIEGNCPSTPSDAAPWNVDCNSADITDRLNTFSEWRGRFSDTNAYWTLMTTCQTSSAVGLAWLGQLCSDGSATSSNNETIAGANVVVRTEGGGSEWQVFAHETGHTFGAVHDCTESTCNAGDSTRQRCCPFSTSSCNAGGSFIMNPSTGSGIQDFSRCSVGNICTALLRQSVRGSCLTNNKNVETITGSQCGNGIVETGEDCDCGGEAGCAGNPCCNPETCLFTTGSVCDPSNEDCCTDQCQIMSQGTVCRSSTGVCDPAEVCNGDTSMCPSDVVSDDGDDCGDGLQCASGQCTSRDLQCRSVLGVPADSTDTYACDRGCSMLCHSDTRLPEENECYIFMQNFLDGTPCDGGGTCTNGICRGASVVEEIGDWLTENKDIVIPVACIVGGLILIAIMSCCIGSWRRSRRQRRVPKPPMGRPPPVAQNSWSTYGGAWGGPTAPVRAQGRGTLSRNRTGGTTSSRTRDRSNTADRQSREPMLPQQGQPPAYSPYSAGVGWQPPQQSRSQSVRYA